MPKQFVHIILDSIEFLETNKRYIFRAVIRTVLTLLVLFFIFAVYVTIF